MSVPTAKSGLQAGAPAEACEICGFNGLRSFLQIESGLIREIRGVEQMRRGPFPALENRGSEIIHPERGRSALFDAEMESCLVLIAQWRVPVKGVQQFGHQADEKKIHRRSHQESCFVAHTWHKAFAMPQKPFSLTSELARIFARMYDFETLWYDFETR